MHRQPPIGGAFLGHFDEVGDPAPIEGKIRCVS